MGYTHYFEQNVPATTEQWKSITDDVRLLFGRCHSLPIQRESDDPGPPEISDSRIWFNGIGDDGHESFVVPKESYRFQFCKTAEKPYDTAVTAVLLLMHHHAPGCWDIRSDGSADEWAPGVDLINTALGIEILPPDSI